MYMILDFHFSLLVCGVDEPGQLRRLGIFDEIWKKTKMDFF